MRLTFTVFFSLPLLMVLTILGAPAMAQQVTTGSVEGTAVDPQGGALPGASVTISSREGVRTLVADAAGQFRFPYLAPGTYSLTVTMQGFNSVEHDNIDVRLGSHIRIEAVLQPGFTETVDVVGTSPVVDLTSTTTGATIPSALMSSVPIGRSFTSAVALAPGVVPSGLDESNPSIQGASGLENTYTIDGVNIGNTGFGSAGSFSGGAGTAAGYFPGYGSLGTGVNIEYIEEVQVKTGGYEPEFGQSLGGFVNLVTKSGGNDVEGSTFAYFQSADLEAQRVRSDRVNAASDPIGFETTDFGFEVGGPLVRDQVFWFTAFDPTFTTQTRATPQSVTDAMGFAHELDVHRSIYSYAANLKWLAGTKHLLALSAFGDPGQSENGPHREDAFAVPDPTLKFSELRFGGHNVVGRWNGELRKDWFVESSVAYHQDSFEEDPSSSTSLPIGIDRSGSGPPVRRGGLGSYAHTKSWRAQYQAKLSNYFRGRGEHHIRYGAEFENIGYDNTTFASGPAGLVLPDGNQTSTGYGWALEPTGEFHLSSRTGALSAKTRARYLAFFASDTWSPVRWLNIMAGIRYEEEKLIGTVSEFKWNDNWAPRLHVTLDPTRDGKSKLAFAYGRFFGKVPNDLAVRALSTEITYFVTYPLSSVDMTDPNLPVIIGPASDSFIFGNVPVQVDPESKLTYQDEYVARADREILPSLRAGVSYTHRSLKRTLEDTQLTSMTDILAGQPFGAYVITNPVPELGFPTPTRRYDAVSFEVEKHLHESWQLLGSYTWSRLVGTYEGYYRRDNGQSDPFVTDQYDFPALKDPDVFQYAIEDGPLPNDRTHVFNLYGSRALEFGLKLGAGLKIQSGMPKTKLGYNPVYGYENYYPIEPRGASGRGPTTTDFGIHADYVVKLGHTGRRLGIVLNVFNLLNQQKSMDFVKGYELGGVVSPPARWGLAPCPECVNPDFGKPTVFQAPRQIQLAARVSL